MLTIKEFHGIIEEEIIVPIIGFFEFRLVAKIGRSLLFWSKKIKRLNGHHLNLRKRGLTSHTPYRKNMTRLDSHPLASEGEGTEQSWQSEDRLLLPHTFSKHYRHLT